MSGGIRSDTTRPASSLRRSQQAPQRLPRSR